MNVQKLGSKLKKNIYRLELFIRHDTQERNIIKKNGRLESYRKLKIKVQEVQEVLYLKGWKGTIFLFSGGQINYVYLVIFLHI